ncbi:unnamed protein product [Aureobasidium pullulans]|nr:unnamed protein product [Aureobasidium pullulans]
MSASQQPLAISPNANRLAVVYRHKFVVSSGHMEENEGQQGFARDQIRRRDEASLSSGIVQPRQVLRGRLNTRYGHVMPQKSIAAWPFLSQPCGHATLTRVNRVSEHLLGWNWTRLLVAANPARCGGSLANDRYKLPDASGPTTDN